VPGVLLVLATAGCGGETTTTSTTVPARTNTPYAAAVCLNETAFLVEAEGDEIRGSSPGGINFTATFYRSADAADAALARLNPAYATVIASAVIDYAGNPPPTPGAAPRRLVTNDLRTLRHCIELRQPG
jgi:hypothetical protein